MATLVFTTLGTALGGPLGGALGALVGNQLDQAIGGTRKHQGPRLKELAVSTSSYGSPIPRHFGQVRTPGTIIWATDLKEAQEQSGGSKGTPSITSYSYSASFAVALASRPIQGIGRIWADGNLLRGAKGDMKVGGSLRIYNGYGDQLPDPLIASDRGPACPAFRNRAYCVFEDLQLASFGNRIPGLTFEVIADDGDVSLSDLVTGLVRPIVVHRPLSELAGFSDEGGPLAGSLASIAQVYPLCCDGSQEHLRIAAEDERPAHVPQLPEPAADAESDSFGTLSGRTVRRQAAARDVPSGLRYYDLDRDYQPGLQRSQGRPHQGRSELIEFPGVLPADKARQLADEARQKASWAGEILQWRVAQIDISLAPGKVVSVPGKTGHWRIESWEWVTKGVELELRKLPPTPAPRYRTDAGEILPPVDKEATPTLLLAFEAPWDGSGNGDARRVYAAASSVSSGWTGAALYAERAGVLSYLRPCGPRRSVIGTLLQPVSGGNSLLFARAAQLTIELASDQFQLVGTTMRGLGEGRNRILVGGEVMQFLQCRRLQSSTWQLSGLLRGRGGTEPAALLGHEAGAPVVLLDGRPVLLDGSQEAIPSDSRIAAIGLADQEPVVSEIINSGLARKPLMPVHPRWRRLADGRLVLSWTRRARGSWTWPETLETPINEQVESYVAGIGDVNAPLARWETPEPRLELSPDAVDQLRTQHPGGILWVRQIGSFGASDPLSLYTFN